MLEHSNWQNSYLIYLGVQDEEELRAWQERLDDCSVFHEPDRNNEMTALASVSDNGTFRSLKLL